MSLDPRGRPGRCAVVVKRDRFVTSPPTGMPCAGRPLAATRALPLLRGGILRTGHWKRGAAFRAAERPRCGRSCHLQVPRDKAHHRPKARRRGESGLSAVRHRSFGETGKADARSWCSDQPGPCPVTGEAVLSCRGIATAMNPEKRPSMRGTAVALPRAFVVSSGHSLQVEL